MTIPFEIVSKKGAILSKVITEPAEAGRSRTPADVWYSLVRHAAWSCLALLVGAVLLNTEA